MFTGIIQEIGAVRSLGRRGGYQVIEISYDESRGALREGDSMAVNGVCLTAVSLGKNYFSADLSGETQRATTLGRLRIGDPVNLERPLTASDPLGGHFVLGHVDGVGRITRYRPQPEGLTVTIAVPGSVMELVVEKGSVTVDGISLTVGPAGKGEFSVFVIPETQKKTTIGKQRQGGLVNVEADYLARLVRKFLGRSGGAGGSRSLAPWAAEE